MEAKNFRIGNIVDLWGSIAYIQRCDFSENEHGIAVDKAKPIKLTEKWLFKLGFNKDYKKGYIGVDYGNTDFVLTSPKVMGEWQDNYCWQFVCTWDKFTEIKYVHQLQNLFFALTGNELEVKHEVSV